MLVEVQKNMYINIQLATCINQSNGEIYCVIGGEKTTLYCGNNANELFKQMLCAYQNNEKLFRFVGENRLYECVKEFDAPLWDDEAQCFTKEIYTIGVGAAFTCTEVDFLCEGNIHLEVEEEGYGIVIKYSEFLENFKDITKPRKQ